MVSEQERAGPNLSPSFMEVLAAEDLPLGQTLNNPIRDPDGKQIAPAGAVITPGLVLELQTRNVRTVWIHHDDVGDDRVLRRGDPAAPRDPPTLDLHTYVTGKLDRLLQLPESLALPPQGTPFNAKRVEHGSTTYDQGLAQQVFQFQQAAAGNMKDLFSSLLTIERNQHTQINKSGALAQSFMQQLLLDTDLVIAKSTLPAENEYLLRHSLQTSVLSMAIAAEIGMDDRNVVIVGMSGLLHDVGMERVPLQIREANRELQPTEFLEITRHVIYSAEIIERGRGVPQSLLLAIYQSHERSDGSGYPRGVRNNGIHIFARILGLADTYLALISPRPYRGAMHPYMAVEEIVHQASKGVFDSNVVRALLRVLSLYPIGSDVILSDGRAGRVIRSNRVDYDRPVVEILLDADGQRLEPTEVVDLGQQNDLRVLQATRLGNDDSELEE